MTQYEDRYFTVSLVAETGMRKFVITIGEGNMYICQRGKLVNSTLEWVGGWLFGRT